MRARWFLGDRSVTACVFHGDTREVVPSLCMCKYVFTSVPSSHRLLFSFLSPHALGFLLPLDLSSFLSSYYSQSFVRDLVLCLSSETDFPGCTQVPNSKTIASHWNRVSSFVPTAFHSPCCFHQLYITFTPHSNKNPKKQQDGISSFEPLLFFYHLLRLLHSHLPRKASPQLRSCRRSRLFLRPRPAQGESHACLRDNLRLHSDGRLRCEE